MNSEALINKKSSAWQDHWSNTGIAAIDLNENSPVSQTLRAHWLQQFAGFSNQHVLDIGAGAGALAALALQNKVALENWTCLDSASTAAKHWLHQAPNCTPRWLTGNFETQLPDAPQDCLISNFGVEYCDLTVVPKQARAWLKDGGTLNWVMHAAGSVIDEQTKMSLSDFDFLDSQTSFKQSAAQLIALANDVPKDSFDRMVFGADQRDAFNRDVNLLKNRMQTAGSYSPVLIQCLQTATGLINAQLKGQPLAEPALETFKRFLQSLELERERLEQMHASALTEEIIARLCNALEDAGFSRPVCQQMISVPQSATGGQPLLIAWTMRCSLNAH